MANSDILKLSNDGTTIYSVYDKLAESITIPDSFTEIWNYAFSGYN